LPAGSSTSGGAQSGGAAAASQESTAAATPSSKQKRKSRTGDESDGDGDAAVSRPRKKRTPPGQQDTTEVPPGDEEGSSTSDESSTEGGQEHGSPGSRCSATGTAARQLPSGGIATTTGNASGHAPSPSRGGVAGPASSCGSLSSRIPKKLQYPFEFYVGVLRDAINCTPGGKQQWTKFACDSDVLGILSHHRYYDGQSLPNMERALAHMQRMLALDIVDKPVGEGCPVYIGYGGNSTDAGMLFMQLYGALQKHDYMSELNTDQFSSMLQVLVLNVWSDAVAMAWQLYDTKLQGYYVGESVGICVDKIAQVILRLNVGRRYVFESVFQRYVKGLQPESKMVVLLEMLQNALFSLDERDLPIVHTQGEDVKPGVLDTGFLERDLQIQYDMDYGDSVLGKDSVLSNRPFTQEAGVLGAASGGSVDNMSVGNSSHLFGFGDGIMFSGSVGAMQPPSGSGDVGLTVAPSVAANPDSQVACSFETNGTQASGVIGINPPSVSGVVGSPMQPDIPTGNDSQVENSAPTHDSQT